MKVNSLRFRLLVSTALLVAVILPLTAFILTSYYRHVVENTIDRQLQVHLDNLIAVSLKLTREETGGREGAEQRRIDLGYPLFRRPFSGWYWQISLPGEEEGVVVSDSLLDERLPIIDENLVKTDPPRSYVTGPEGQVLRLMQKTIFSGGEKPGEARHSFIYEVAIDARELDDQVARFRNLLLLALGVLGLGLVAAGLAQTRYALSPLDDISRRLNDIRAGRAESLSGDMLEEIEPLQKELNALIHSNRDVVERARTHVGNLAHALKTPLSVISNEIKRLRDNPSCGGNDEAASGAANIDRQIAIMRDQVRHHLDRARMAARTGVIGNRTLIRPALDSLARTLGKIYRERNLQIELECPDDLAFHGEKQDLEEMLGNLLDNACKYADAHVLVKAIPPREGEDFILISVDDDGEGLTREKRRKAMQRGQRLDEKTPGSGLGLSIVADLSHLYHGSLRLKDSTMGGLRAELLLPQAAS
jgi:signal transduction histidine kinase